MLKLGIVGFSEGNGHPFSWAAACNGYSKNKINKIPFERIKNYLPKYNLDYLKIDNAKVTHIWTQDYEYSRLIAEITKINTVCKHLSDLSKNVDAILFLRDDIENREEHLLELIKTGKPIYVDKFLHYNQNKVLKYLKLQKYKNQIFSESPLVNNKKINLNKLEVNEIGKIVNISCYSPGNWKFYSIHIIEPCLKFVKNKKIKKIESYNSNFSSNVIVKWEDDLITTFSTIKDSNFIPSTKLIGLKSQKEIYWDLDYILDYFISTLRKFIFSVKSRESLKNEKNYSLVAKIIQAGLVK